VITRSTHARRLGVRFVAPVVAAAVLLLAGCTADSDRLAANYEQGDNSGGYVSGDGRTVQPPASQREDPVAFSGTLDTGDAFDSSDVLGDVVVVNFWYAGCPPCREEAPDLEALRAQYDGDGVTFVGVNVSDNAGTARSFAQEFGVGYPSIIDVDDNGVQLAFAAGKLAPNSVPTTLILDKQGRVAARLSGLITSPSVVTDIVDELLAEKA
jgi:thiol-disulfide isomerase/thioredoxin